VADGFEIPVIRVDLLEVVAIVEKEGLLGVKLYQNDLVRGNAAQK